MLPDLRNLYLILWACLYAGMNVVFNVIANESLWWVGDNYKTC